MEEINNIDLNTDNKEEIKIEKMIRPIKLGRPRKLRDINEPEKENKIKRNVGRPRMTEEERKEKERIKLENKKKVGRPKLTEEEIQERKIKLEEEKRIKREELNIRIGRPRKYKDYQEYKKNNYAQKVARLELKKVSEDIEEINNILGKIKDKTKKSKYLDSLLNVLARHDED